MSYACPHCSKDIPNVLPEEEHVKRLKAKTEENVILKTQLTDANGKLAKLPELEQQLAEATGRIQGVERSAALAKVGVVDEKTAKIFDLIYESETASMKAEERPAFAEFEKWVGDHPVLHPLLKPPAAAPPGAPPKPGTPPNPPPKGPPTANPPVGGRLTIQQREAYFQSNEWKSMSNADKAKKLDEMEAEVNAAQAG